MKKEYEEKLKKKKKGKDKKEKEKAKSKIKDDDAPAEEEKEPEERLKELEGRKEKEGAVSEGPRVFELHKSVFQMRVQRLRGQMQAQQMQKRLRDPGLFPSVPSGGV